MLRIARLSALVVMLLMGWSLLRAQVSPSGALQAQKRAGEARAAAQTPAAPRPAAQPARPAEGASKADDRRDPFKSMIQPTKEGPAPELRLDCPPGVRGIIIGQIELNGVVRGPSGPIAVITTRSNDRTFFVRENATMCNGKVLRIAEDSMVLEENVIEPNGTVSRREVIRKIPADAK